MIINSTVQTTFFVINFYHIHKKLDLVHLQDDNRRPSSMNGIKLYRTF